MSDNVIAKEGHKSILIAFIAMLVFIILECEVFVFVTFAITGFLLFTYRYKYIDIKSLNKDEIYAPISGKVSAIDVKDFKKSIHIDVGLLDSHILRALESSSVSIVYKRGLNLSLGSLKARKLNETVIIKSDNLTIQLISSICNNSIEVSSKKRYEKGEKIGVFIHGKVIVTLPSNTITDLKIGQELKDGMTVIAKITS